MEEIMFDWNKLTLPQMVEYLRQKYMFSSTGDAKCIYHLIEFYDKHYENTPVIKSVCGYCKGTGQVKIDDYFTGCVMCNETGEQTV